ncbi:MAG TPA: hypothetical protein VFH62_00005 [Dehalococcoidia bacterium]|nr:hypothetical protein [Dehalococcoidia bacterium]
MNMFGDVIFVEARMWELEQNIRRVRPERHNRGIPEAEAPRTGIGLVHEVFRRITQAA